MFIAATSALLLTVAAQAATPASQDADLFCRGRGDRLVTTQTKIRKEDGTIVNRSEQGRVPFTGAIHLRVAGGTGQAMLPSGMLGPEDTAGWHEVKKLAVTGQTITGKIYFDWLYSPVMTVNRATGTMTVSGSLSNFSGTCARYDPRTAKMPPAAPRPATASQSVGGGAQYTPPPSSDPRAAARRLAGQTDARATARGAAMKADLAFRLFNASATPISEFVMMGTSGKPSANWLRAGERVAPSLFRSLNFANSQVCTHTARVTFANGAKLLRPINFCGKNTLFVSDRDMWME